MRSSWGEPALAARFQVGVELLNLLVAQEICEPLHVLVGGPLSYDYPERVWGDAAVG